MVMVGLWRGFVPLPPKNLVLELSTCSNSMKSLDWSGMGIPIPESSTLHVNVWMSVAVMEGVDLSVTRINPVAVNFDAERIIQF